MDIVGQRVRIKKGVTPYPGKKGTIVQEFAPVQVSGQVAYEVKLDVAFSVPHTKLYKADEVEFVRD